MLWVSTMYTVICPMYLQLDQPQPEAEVALALGQSTLDKVEGITYNALIQVN